MVPKILFATIAVCLLGLIGLAALNVVGGETPDSLCDEALTGPDQETKIQAALKLSLLGQPAVPALRRMLKESDVSEVRAAAIDGLAAQKDWDSMPAFIDALQDGDVLVQARAAEAVNRLFGRHFNFRPDMSTEERMQTIEFIREMHQKIVNTPPDQHYES